ncbi:hypothetical protein [Myxococcus xanthus]|uniref:hypothetical protein n=1 Tax=Myxococcus xanthus TaxID=34 RepID=UPI001376359C|nr:hypothetical protein [Myxococcus xanthus]
MLALALRPENDDPGRLACVVAADFTRAGEIPARRIGPLDRHRFRGPGREIEPSPITVA